MVYISKMKQKLDSIRKAFEKYIDNQGYFSILYSKKVGYLWIVVAPPRGAGIQHLGTPERVLENTPYTPDACILTTWEELESRRQFTSILEQNEGGGADCLEYLDKHLQNYQGHYAGDGELC